MEGKNFKRNVSQILLMVLVFVISASFASASTDVLDVTVTEYVSEILAYDQTLGAEDPVSDSYVVDEAPGELGENDSGISRTGHSLYEFMLFGDINITNVEENATVVSINVTMNGTNDVTFINFSSGPEYVIYNISTGTDPVNEPNISIFIPELRAGDSVMFDFNITDNSSALGEPLNFTENFTSWRMMTGNSTGVILNATNSFPTSVLLYDLEITKTPACYPSVDGQSCFRYTDLAGEDSGNAAINTTTSKTILEWNASGGTLAQYESRQIRFNAWAPENLTIFWNDSADWATWMNMGNISSTFKFNGSMSGLELIDVKGITPYARVGVSKDRNNETNWNATFNITNDAPSDIDYNLTQVSVWATKYQQYDDPGNIDTWVNETNVSAYGFVDSIGPYANATWWPRLNLSSGSTMNNYSINFNYSLVPVVWSTSNFRILDDGTQIFKLNQSKTVDGGYLFIEEIYVLLGGYLIKSTKTITPLEIASNNNTYKINITLENVGREKTPEWVSMFDLIPKDFWPLRITTDVQASNRNMTNENIINVSNFAGGWEHLPNNPDTVLGYADTGNIASGAYKDYWGYHIDFNGLNATSDGDGRYDASASTKEIGITYKITGNSTLSRVENAYLVGVDPIRLEGANPSKTVASRLAASSTTMEYVVLIASLVISVTILGVGFGFVKKK